MLDADMGETIIMRIASNQGWHLKIAASTASTTKVLDLLRRMQLKSSQDKIIPFCTTDELPQLAKAPTAYNWDMGEATPLEVQKGKAWLKEHICPTGVRVLAVQNQAWLQANLMAETAEMTASKTDFLFVLDEQEVRDLPEHPTPEQLIGVLHCVIGAYESKTTQFITQKGILGVWPQAMVEALAINYMSSRNSCMFFVPVFGGDFNTHLVVHAAPTSKHDDYELHTATHISQDQELAVRYMRYLLEQTQTAAQLGLQGIAISLLPMMLHELVVVTACLCASAKIKNIGPRAFEEKQLGGGNCVA